MIQQSRLLAPIARHWNRLRTDRRGNVLMLMGFAVIPLTFATGMSIDYARAARLQTKLNAIADAAALSAVTQPSMEQTDETQVQTAAKAMFDAQASTLVGLSGSPVATVSLTHPDGANSRAVTISYTANSINAFSGVFKMPTIAIGGSSTARATAAPNMDFYLALDTSPSMALPTTSAGIASMDTMMQCSFACHSNKIEQYVTMSMPHLVFDNATSAIVKGSYGTSGTGNLQKQQIDSGGAYVYVNRTTGMDSRCKPSGYTKDICVYNADGTFVDSYWLALNKGIQLRVTAERGAVTDLMDLATSYAAQNHRTYRAALYTFDHSTQLNTIQATPTDLATIKTKVPSITVATVNDKQANGWPLTSGSSSNAYLFTSFKSILDKMTTVMPNPSGHGTDVPGDTPAAYLFLVTDGMSDEDIGSGRTRSAMQAAQITQCNTLKSRGIKIAILYTEYTVASIQDDEPTQRAIATAAIPNIAPALTQCASPGLMFTVKTDESISTALQSLFSKAIATARIIQ